MTILIHVTVIEQIENVWRSPGIIEANYWYLCEASCTVSDYVGNNTTNNKSCILFINTRCTDLTYLFTTL